MRDYEGYRVISNSISAATELVERALYTMPPTAEAVEPKAWIDENYGDVYLILQSVSALLDGANAVMTAREAELSKAGK